MKNYICVGGVTSSRSEKGKAIMDWSIEFGALKYACSGSTFQITSLPLTELW